MPMIGLTPGGLGLLVEVVGAVQVAVVGHRQRGHLAAARPRRTGRSTRAAPSSIEYSVCTCRCTNESLDTGDALRFCTSHGPDVSPDEADAASRGAALPRPGEVGRPGEPSPVGPPDRRCRGARSDHAARRVGDLAPGQGAARRRARRRRRRSRTTSAAGDVLLEVGQGARAGDRQHDRGRGAAARPAPAGPACAPVRAASASSGPPGAGQLAARDREPRDEADALRRRSGRAGPRSAGWPGCRGSARSTIGAIRRAASQLLDADLGEAEVADLALVLTAPSSSPTWSSSGTSGSMRCSW